MSEFAIVLAIMWAGAPSTNTRVGMAVNATFSLGALICGIAGIWL